MGRAEHEFWESTHRKIMKVIDMYIEEINMNNAALGNSGVYSQDFNESVAITSMRQMEGFV